MRSVSVIHFTSRFRTKAGYLKRAAVRPRRKTHRQVEISSRIVRSVSAGRVLYTALCVGNLGTAVRRGTKTKRSNNDNHNRQNNNNTTIAETIVRQKCK